MYSMMMPIADFDMFHKNSYGYFDSKRFLDLCDLFDFIAINDITYLMHTSMSKLNNISDFLEKITYLYQFRNKDGEVYMVGVSNLTSEDIKLSLSATRLQPVVMVLGKGFTSKNSRLLLFHVSCLKELNQFACKSKNIQ